MAHAIKVNPFVFLTPDAITTNAQAVALAEGLFSRVEIEEGIDWIYSGLSHNPDSGHGEPQSVDTFEVAPVAALSGITRRTLDAMYVDENGLANNVNDVWIIVRGAWQPFAGAGLVCGTSRSGGTISPTMVSEDWLVQNTIILCQNALYIPRLGKIGFCQGRRAVEFAIRADMINFNSAFWTEEDLL